MNNRYFFLLWIASFISAIGSGLTSFGLGIYVFERSGLSSMTGAVMLAGFLPGLLLSPLAGVLADRYDRRLLMLVGDGLSALGIIYIYISFSMGSTAIYPVIIGVIISSIFSSLVEPAFKATVSDLLYKEDFTRASSLMQLTGSAKFLISPVIAGILLSHYTIKVLLLIDISTIFVMVAVTGMVREVVKISQTSCREINQSFLVDLKEGWSILKKNRGLWNLVLTFSVISFFLGTLQTLSTPLILSFAEPDFLGFCITVSASGIIVSSIILSMIKVRRNFHRILCFSLSASGLFMAGFGATEDRVLICIFGFCFFSMLPLANMSLDYLARTNISNSVQGRVWDIIGILSQLGYVVAFMLSGLISDYLFVPLFKQRGIVSEILRRITGVGEGRGFGLTIIVSGICLLLSAISLYRNKHIRKLEEKNVLATN